MPQWRVRDVMTTEVITARHDASVAEIAAMLAGRRISAVPIVDRFDVVVGVVDPRRGPGRTQQDRGRYPAANDDLPTGRHVGRPYPTHYR